MFGREFWRTVQSAIEDRTRTVRLIAILITIGLITVLTALVGR
ncbi:hypothetical protein [Kitasatospora sp. NPDC101183]